MVLDLNALSLPAVCLHVIILFLCKNTEKLIESSVFFMDLMKSMQCQHHQIW